MVRIYVITAIAFLSACSGPDKSTKKDQVKIKIEEDQNTIEPKADEPVEKTEKHSYWTVQIGKNILSIENFGSCLGNVHCDFEDYILVKYKDRKIFSKRSFPAKTNFLDSDQVTKNIVLVRSWEADDFEKYEEEFKQKKSLLSSEANKMEINEVFDIDRYKAVKAAEHYLQTRRCSRSYLIENFRKECPLDDGNMNISNASMDVLAGFIAMGVFTVIQYSIKEDQLVSLAVLVNTDPRSNFVQGIKGRGYNRYLNTFNYLSSKNKVSYNSINPVLFSNLGFINHRCANLYELKAYGGKFTTSVSRLYNREVNPDWEDELSKQLIVAMQIPFNDWKYSGHEHSESITDLFSIEKTFPDMFYTDKYLENKLYKGEACEGYIENN